jgi:hypothetical protein
VVDIRGTNEFDKQVDEEWCSILVKTGVWQPGSEPAYKPKVTVDTVLDAIKWGMDRSRTAALKEMHELSSGSAE